MEESSEVYPIQSLQWSKASYEAALDYFGTCSHVFWTSSRTETHQPPEELVSLAATSSWPLVLDYASLRGVLGNLKQLIDPSLGLLFSFSGFQSNFWKQQIHEWDWNRNSSDVWTSLRFSFESIQIAYEIIWYFLNDLLKVTD